MKKGAVFFNVLGLSFLLISSAAAEDVLNAGDRAKKIHELASSDVIYTDQESKALYYQNVQIIDLLTQIRDLLDVRLKESKN